jgi:hypothetical protein
MNFSFLPSSLLVLVKKLILSAIPEYVYRRRVGCCGGRVGGVQSSEGAAEGDEPPPHPRRPRRSSLGSPLLQQQEQQEHRSRSGLRLLLAAAVGDRRRRQRERTVGLVNSPAAPDKEDKIDSTNGARSRVTWWISPNPSKAGPSHGFVYLFYSAGR